MSESTIRIGGPCTLEELERAHIIATLRTAPSLGTAAETLGIDPATLYRKRKRHGLDNLAKLPEETKEPENATNQT